MLAIPYGVTYLLWKVLLGTSDSFHIGHMNKWDNIGTGQDIGDPLHTDVRVLVERSMGMGIDNLCSDYLRIKISDGINLLVNRDVRGVLDNMDRIFSNGI